MKTPEALDVRYLAPCGNNCAFCYKHVGSGIKAACEGCLAGDKGKTKRCLTCKIRACAQAKGMTHCFTP